MKYVITLNGRTYEVEAETAEPLPIEPIRRRIYVRIDRTIRLRRLSGTNVVALGNGLARRRRHGRSAYAGYDSQNQRIRAETRIKKGSVLLVLEAMKMENEIVAAKDGVVARILTNKGSAVEANTPLLVLK